MELEILKKKAEYFRKYYSKNKEKIIARCLKYYHKNIKTNPEKMKEIRDKMRLHYYVKNNIERKIKKSVIQKIDLKHTGFTIQL